MSTLTRLIHSSKHSVFFGGAGVSTESGIPDFRSKSGLYAAQSTYGYPPEELLSRRFFEKEPLLFFRYYKENLIAKGAKPNPAHRALAQLETAGLLQAVITQNVDGLHQEAGSQNVIELHGSNWRHHCLNCAAEYSLGYILDPARCRDEVVPVCESCGSIVRPDVVLYGETLDDRIMERAIRTISAADLLIVGGTSLAVYPAAGLLQYFRGEQLILINKSETPYDHLAGLVYRESIGRVLQETLSQIEADG